MPTRHGLLCVVLGTLAAVNAQAQACRGRPGFTRATAIVNTGAMVASDAKSISAGLTAGLRDGLLASVAIGYVVRDASPTFSSDQRGPSLGASIAYAGTEAGGRVELCPGLGYSRIRVSGDFIDGRPATLTQTTRRAGVSAGYTLRASPAVLVIPFASAEYVWFSGSVTGESVHFLVPDDTYLPLTVGLGMVWNERLGITAGAIIPTRLPAGVGRNSFVTSLSLALGGKPRA